MMKQFEQLTTAFTNTNLIDGTCKIIKEATVVVKGNIIKMLAQASILLMVPKYMMSKA